MTTPQRRKRMMDLRREVEALEASGQATDSCEDEESSERSSSFRRPDPQTPEDFHRLAIERICRAWNQTSLTSEDEDSVPQDGDAVIERPVALESLSMELLETTADRQGLPQKRRFRASIIGQPFDLSVWCDIDLEFRHEHPALGLLTLDHWEPDDAELEESCKPRGFRWEGDQVRLCALPQAAPHPARATLGESIERLPVLLAHAERLAALDRAILRDEIVDFLLNESVDGPWWYYQDRWSTFDCSDEEEEGKELRSTERWRTLQEIFADHGPPSLLVFADGSAVATCIHRTGFKSDVFYVHVIRDPTGRLTHADVVCVYYGE